MYKEWGSVHELSCAGPRAGRRRGRGTGNPGKPGKRLRLEDLQSQFGVGLKEAANRLGICPTTLKARAGSRGPGPGRLSGGSAQHQGVGACVRAMNCLPMRTSLASESGRRTRLQVSRGLECEPRSVLRFRTVVLAAILHMAEKQVVKLKPCFRVCPRPARRLRLSCAKAPPCAAMGEPEPRACVRSAPAGGTASSAGRGGSWSS